MISMGSSMDDRRVLADMERCLSRDDPDLVTLIDTLNRQFPDNQDTDSRNDGGGGGHDWRWKATVAFVVVLVVGLILTLIFSGSPSAEDDPASPNGRAPEVSSVSPVRPGQ
ncbi:hypothetical protein ACIBAG_27800 [Streptomyces sp. NPDC051243]|uniref:hypothetical protein n=1 Tax=Streptomyces sp. NPDC051243 TaxID=3365646 RepID=UPI00379BE894